MDFLLTYFIIPGLTLLLPGQRNWFTSNFSAAGAYYPRNLLLLTWAFILARFYQTYVKRMIGQIHSFLSTEYERIMTDLSAWLLLGSVFLPYRPETVPLLSLLHLIMAFSSTVLFFLMLTMITGKLYVLAPDLFSCPASLLMFAFSGSLLLLILCDFLITSALEIFLTVFSCIWLRIFSERITRFRRRVLQSRIQSLKTEQRV